MKEGKLITLFLVLGIILSLVGGALAILLLFFEALYGPELPLSFLMIGAFLLGIGFFLEWRKNRMWN